MVRSRSRKDVPDVQVPKRKATVFEIEANALLMELEARKEQHQQKWGIDRLITLVDSEFRVKFWTQMGRVWDALEFEDLERLRKAVTGMVKGYDALERWAEENEIAPNPSQIRFVEWKAINGLIMAVTETIHDCIDLQKVRPDLRIWTLQEFEVILNNPAVQEIMKIKALEPTAQVVRFTPKPNFAQGSGFDDMEDDFEPLMAGGEPEKLFQLPARK